MAVELCCEDIRGGWLISWSSKYSYSGWKSATRKPESRESTDSPADDLTYAVISDTVGSSGTGISSGPFFLPGLAEDS